MKTKITALLLCMALLLTACTYSFGPRYCFLDDYPDKEEIEKELPNTNIIIGSEHFSQSAFYIEIYGGNIQTKADAIHTLSVFIPIFFTNENINILYDTIQKKMGNIGLTPETKIKIETTQDGDFIFFSIDPTIHTDDENRIAWFISAQAYISNHSNFELYRFSNQTEQFELVEASESDKTWSENDIYARIPGDNFERAMRKKRAALQR